MNKFRFKLVSNPTPLYRLSSARIYSKTSFSFWLWRNHGTDPDKTVSKVATELGLLVAWKDYDVVVMVSNLRLYPELVFFYLHS